MQATGTCFLFDSMCSVCIYRIETLLNMRQVSLCFRGCFFHFQGNALFTPARNTHSQPRACSALSSSEGCNLLEASAMTLLLRLNNWLSCGVTWVRAINLTEPQTLKDRPPKKVAMICFAVFRLRSPNFSLSFW